ncbi:ABC transporter ATP-binding protein [Lactococcus piscium]|uniref:ABC transporter ATP-binding protein n=1 Tax=Pseudolactococcus piscium TaxID=1364 RepID=A0A2A5RUW7_9LACT|nr:ATP-binding cassette domain-containing protein [Lactococcus piscium]PCS04990.1 ABC transporter ATP-binding protein [Lactococcus piscium]
MLQVKNLSKTFGNKTVYQAVNLSFKAGHTYAIIGQSGSGKTTLLNNLARLEKPSSGQILLADKDIWKMKEKTYFKQTLGYIFQNYALIDDISISKNLSVVEKNKIKQVEALQKVGLDDSFLSQKIYSLSGGQAQRVTIARILLKRARLILADEPTGALDAKTGSEIRDLLLGLANEDTVVIFATHDPDIYENVDHVINLSQDK